MKEFAGATGLILNEPLLWEKGKKGRFPSGISGLTQACIRWVHAL